MAEKAKHPIRVVTNRTGLTPDLLRAWERRYGVVAPTRSPGGQRLYSDADVERLALLHRAVLSGRAIRTVASLSDGELAALIGADERAGRLVSAEALPALEAAQLAAARAACMSAIERLDAESLKRTLRGAVLQLGVPALLEGLIAPLLHELGERWECGELIPPHEHLASVEIRQLLLWMVESAQVDARGPVILVTTPAGQRIELGALLVAASAAAEGWSVVYFGADLPAADIARAASELGARAVALSIVHATREAALRAELEALAKALKGKRTLIVGGRASSPYALRLRRFGAVFPGDLEGFRAWLREHGKTTRGRAS